MTKNSIIELGPIGDPYAQPSGSCLLSSVSCRLFNPISAITSIAGGFIGSSAAKSAANTINTADQAAAQSAIDTTAKVNPDILNTAKTAGDNVVSTAQTGADAATAAAAKAAADAKATAETGNQNVNAATKSANDLLNPYSSAGADASKTLQTGLTAGGDFNKTPTLQDLQIDPGYAFRLQQGSQTLDRSAAARGATTGGAATKAQIDFAQGSASQEYQNAFNRFETSTQNRYNNLSGVANRGLTAGTTQGTNLVNAGVFGANSNNTAAQYGGNLNYAASTFGAGANNTAAQYAGTANINATDQTSSNTINADKTASDYRVGGATAIGQGKVGAANAWTGALNGVGNAAMYGSPMSFLQNPAQVTQLYSNGQSLQVAGSQAATGVL